MKDNPVDKRLLFRYFSGRATVMEQSEIKKWLEQENNYEVFFDTLRTWEISNLQYLPDSNTGYENLQKKIQRLETEGQQDSRLTRSIWRGMRIWSMIACVGVLFLVGFLFRERLLYRTITTTYAETRAIVLNDESKIVLNANSSVRIPRFVDWYQDREVWITGEAFFTVQKKTDRQKFIVHTPELNVEVLGTSFNVNSRNKKTKVVLEKGKVRVVSNIDTHKTLAILEQTGDFVETDGEMSDIITGQVDYSLYTIWQDRMLKFDKTPLSQVLQSINDFYGVVIQCADSTILARNFSGTLPNDNLDIILRSLSNIYSTEFTPNQNPLRNE